MKILKVLIAAGAMVAIHATAAESVTPKFEQAISNIPGKSLIALEVLFPPATVAAPHHRANSAFLYVYVISGTIRSQVEG